MSITELVNKKLIELAIQKYCGSVLILISIYYLFGVEALVLATGLLLIANYVFVTCLMSYNSFVLLSTSKRDDESKDQTLHG